jgi:hypothetical protein
VFSRKYRIHAALLLVSLLIIFLPLYNEKPDEQKAQAAAAAAAEFLALVDADKFAESYQRSAKLLKEKVSEQQWVEQLRKTRAVAGPLLGRSQKEISYSTTAQDSPEGEYILILFDSNYQAKPGATETITLMLARDATWRVAGYFIK